VCKGESIIVQTKTIQIPQHEADQWFYDSSVYVYGVRLRIIRYNPYTGVIELELPGNRIHECTLIPNPRKSISDVVHELEAIFSMTEIYNF
jgi:hypothetical protein